MHETSKAAAVYAMYEAMGPERTYPKLAAALGKHSGYTRQIETWASQFHWQARVQAYDEVQRERERQQRAAADAERARRKLERELRREAARDKMDDDRAGVFGAEWVKALKAINNKLADGDTRGLMGLVSVLNRALDEERLSLGSPTQMTAIMGKDGGAIEVVNAHDEIQRRLASLAGANRASGVPERTD